MSRKPSLWSRAYICACEAHKRQKDKAGRLYIHHPLYVARQFPEGSDASIVGLLHDVLEDSDMTPEDLRAEPWSIPARLVKVVQVLTHKDDGMTYMEYIRKVKEVPLARKVKIEDLKHNMDMTRLPNEPTPQDISRTERYRKALAILESEE